MMKVVIVYYSYQGNTKKIADMIKNETGADIARIETVKEYEGDYNAVVDQGHDEVRRGYMPEIKPLGIDLADYDTVILATPVWWYTFAPAMKTFLENSSFSGKTVFPFATNGGWIGHTFEDFEKSCKGAAEVKDGLDVRFDTNSMRTPESKGKGMD